MSRWALKLLNTRARTAAAYDPSGSIKPNSTGGEPRGTHLARDGDGSLGDIGSDDDGDDKADAVIQSLTSQPTTTNAAKKKNRKKSKKMTSLKQSIPPQVPLADLFPNGKYPSGEIQPNISPVDNTARTTAEEVRYESRRRIQDDTWRNNYHKAAEIHRQVRRWTQASVRQGQGLTEIAVGIEDGEIFLQASDVMKVDFGVHINGWIVDSAFTMSFDPTYDNLLAAVKDATNTGIKNSGVDVRISDVSAAIQEAMESYEVEIRGQTFPVKAVRHLAGHNLKPYQIHGEKSIPFVKNKDQTKMEDGEVFAIETFGTTGRGSLKDGPGVYGYGKDPYAPKRVMTHLALARSLYKTINDNFGSIVFCRRYLERLGVKRYLAGMNNLASQGVVEVYPPLMDIEGSYSAQFEHLILFRLSCWENPARKLSVVERTTKVY
ncbi:peptidase M24, structural domain-containing protein [Lipomyces mesembrius]